MTQRADVGFTGPDACKALGITYRVLDYWDRCGVVTPSISAARGPGSQRRYSHDDLVRLCVGVFLARVGRSRGNGVSLEWIGRALARLPQPIPLDGVLVLGDSTVAVAASLDEVVLDGATVVLSFELVHEHLAAAVPAVAVSSSPNPSHGVRHARPGGEETGAARPSLEQTGLPGSGPMSPPDDPRGSAVAVAGEGGDLLGLPRDTAHVLEHAGGIQTGA